MESITLLARAKINLALDIMDDRPDGYHELRTVMQTVSLSDQVTIQKTNVNILRLSTNEKRLPVDHRNLAYRAAETLLRRFDIKSGVLIDLHKKIPLSAGLAGGSSDCAAVLVGMCELFDLPLTMQELQEIGESFGADVPFCILGGTALAEGIGEKLTPLPPHPFSYVLIAKPPVDVSTAEVFSRFDSSKALIRPNMQRIMQALYEKSITDLAGNLCNVLETVTIPMHPVISRIKSLMLENGSCGSLMSGSGPSVFGYYTNKAEALRGMEHIRTALHINECFVTEIDHRQRERT